MILLKTAAELFLLSHKNRVSIMLLKHLKFLTLLIILFIFKINAATLLLIPQDSLNNVNAQGGILEFKKSYIQRYCNSSENLDTLFLNNYSGLPLKAMQFKIKIENGNRILKIKSVKNGSALPSELYLFDYYIHNGLIDSEGNLYDMVSVVFLGNGWNALAPANKYHIATLEYDIGEINPNIENIINIRLTDVFGATADPIMDALIKTDGYEKINITQYQSTVSDDAKCLYQNYPNPFNPVTKIQYSIAPFPLLEGARGGLVTLKVYDILGKEVVTLVNEIKSAGNYTVDFNASELPSGVYIYQLTAPGFTQARKMILAK